MAHLRVDFSYVFFFFKIDTTEQQLTCKYVRTPTSIWFMYVFSTKYVGRSGNALMPQKFSAQFWKKKTSKILIAISKNCEYIDFTVSVGEIDLLRKHIVSDWWPKRIFNGVGLMTQDPDMALNDDNMSDDVFIGSDEDGSDLKEPKKPSPHPSPTGYRDYKPPVNILSQKPDILHKVSGICKFRASYEGRCPKFGYFQPQF